MAAIAELLEKIKEISSDNKDRLETIKNMLDVLEGNIRFKEFSEFKLLFDMLESRINLADNMFLYSSDNLLLSLEDIELISNDLYDLLGEVFPYIYEKTEKMRVELLSLERFVNYTDRKDK